MLTLAVLLVGFGAGVLPALAKTPPKTTTPKTTPTTVPTGPAEPTTTTPPPAPAPPTLTLGSAAILPLPAGSAGFVPAAMDCSTGTCVIVGYLQMPNGGVVAGAAWGSGTTWTTAPLPMPSAALTYPGGAASSLGAVSCATAVACTAIGAFGPSGSAQLNGLIESWNGATWSAAAAPVPGNAATNTKAGSELRGITCPIPTSCAIVGSYTGPGDGSFPLLVTGSGGSWTNVLVALPADAGPITPSSGPQIPSGSGTLTSVACPTPTACVAVGDYATAMPGRQSNGLIVVGSDTTWTPVPVVGPSGFAELSLSAVACASTNSCLIVGSAPQSSSASSAPTAAVVVQGDGATWSTVTTPLPPGISLATDVSFKSVTCVPNGICTAFGVYNPAGAQVGGVPAGYFNVTGSGPGLAVQTATVFTNWVGFPWSTLSCPQPTTLCVSGWNAWNSPAQVGTVPSLALGWGSTWTTTQIPTPQAENPSTPMSFVDVGCTSQTSCLALVSGQVGPGSGPGLTPTTNAAVVQVSVPNVANPPATTTTTTTAPPTPTTITTVPKVTPATSAASPDQSAVGSLSAHRQSVNPTVILSSLAALLLLALLALWVLIIKATRPDDVGDDGELIPLGSSPSVSGPSDEAVVAGDSPAPGSMPAPSGWPPAPVPDGAPPPPLPGWSLTPPPPPPPSSPPPPPPPPGAPPPPFPGWSAAPPPPSPGPPPNSGPPPENEDRATSGGPPPPL